MTETATAASFDTSRDRHLFGPGPKRLLSLDGGGVRGALTVAILERIEKLLSEHHGRQVRLGDHFDLVGGTSTGAIIAGALALGYRTAQVKDFYLRLAPFAFKRQRLARSAVCRRSSTPAACASKSRKWSATAYCRAPI